MKHAPAIARFISMSLLAVSPILFTSTGCQWGSTRSRADWDLTDAQRDSLDIYFSDYAGLKSENKRLKTQIDEQQLETLKLQGELDLQAEYTEFLKSELKQLHYDLDQFENQFVSFEKHLTADENKASAIAAIAEAQLLFEKLKTDYPDVLDSLTTLEAATKLEKSSDMIKRHNFSASVYFSTRAVRILNLAERKQNHSFPSGASSIITVSIANMRTGPGADFEVIDQLKYGTFVVQLTIEDNWCEVKTNDGKSGWVHKSLIR